MNALRGEKIEQGRAADVHDTLLQLEDLPQVDVAARHFVQKLLRGLHALSSTAENFVGGFLKEPLFT
jgi:hypothetical protein